MSKDKNEYTGDIEANYKQSIKKKYLVLLNKNSPKEFSIGRIWYRFEPFEIKEMTESEINHKDFIQQKNYFSIKEV
jgi:hypothetical protein